MALERFDKIWKLLSDYKFNFDEYLSVEIRCFLCKDVMRDPYISICGCRFCYHCIQHYIVNEGRRCPCCNDNCTIVSLEINKNIFKDIHACHSIEKITIECPHYSCTVMVKLNQMDEHVRICPMKPIHCPYEAIGCSSGSTNLGNHMNQESFQHAQLLIEEINHLRNDVNREKCIPEIVFLKNENHQKDISIREMKIEIDFLKEAIHILNTRINETVTNITEEFQRTLNIFQSDLKDVKKESTAFSSEIKKINIRINEQILNAMNDYVWAIRSFPKKNGTTFSDSFYKDNYEFRLRADINNITGGYLDLYIAIMRGEKDDWAMWPMMHTISIKIINQKSLSTHIGLSCNYRVYGDKTVFQKPFEKMNGGIYLGRIQNIDVNEENGVLFCDCLIICCTMSMT